MRTWTPLACAVALALVLTPPTARATDVDGPDDCTKAPAVDFGDAPEDVLAYPGGIMGHFPTCRAQGAPGNQTFACPPISTPPGAFAGYVRHVHPAAGRIWLGCTAAMVQPLGVDGEPDGKVNDNGGAVSACGGIGVDCVATYGAMSWGQDEAYGTNDACLAAPPTMKACGPGNVNWTFSAFNCNQQPHSAFLNILVDFNHDGDWNDNFQCAGGCANEWAVKNIQVNLQPGCNAVFVPTFRVGPIAGPAWMRISISDNPATDDYPWAGSELMPGQAMSNGETEDYIVTILPSENCPVYEDWGDAPENAAAYPGVIGHFPTCFAPGPPSAMDGPCAPLGPPPGPPVGYVRHVATATDPAAFWLGCGNAASIGVDSEPDGKMNDNAAPVSQCNNTIPVDCLDFFGINWGQDECYGDGDAGLSSPTTVFFKTCNAASLAYQTYNCGTQSFDVFLNICIDLNEDGDWNDSFICDTPNGPVCVYEWAVRNIGITLLPGCQTHLTPPIQIGPKSGKGWMRITLSRGPVPLDFPWNGSASMPGGFFPGGETEDYPVAIRPENVGVGDDLGGGDGTLQLARIAPNPAMDHVAVRFTLPRAAEVSLAAFDLAGRKLADLAHGRMQAGAHQVGWDFRTERGHEFRAGYYVIRLRVGDRVLSQTGMRVR